LLSVVVWQLQLCMHGCLRIQRDYDDGGPCCRCGEMRWLQPVFLRLRRSASTRADGYHG
jgi:hypothetical protein